MVISPWRLQLVILTAISCCVCARENDSPPALSGPNATPSAQTQSKPAKTDLDIDTVLGWRHTYGDLIGKPKEAAVERYGQADGEEGEDTLQWNASTKTDNRNVVVVLADDAKAATITAVKVYARPGESLEPIEVIRRATLFNFDSGTYKDTSTDYFMARTKDNRNAYQFDIKDGIVTFRRMLFIDPRHFDIKPK